MINQITSSAAVVLVVEDEPIQRFDLVELVVEAGFCAVEAISSTEALRVLEGASDVRVMLTDIVIPGGLDGLKLAEQVHVRWPEIGIVIVSGRRPKAHEMPDEAMFFCKPLRREEIAAAIHRLMS